jgi:zinc/manganese transport system substrate-binding protein
MHRRILSLLAALILSSVPAFAAQPVKVVATFSILGDMVKNVGGDRIALTVIVGPNSDTHVYEPTPADAKTLAGADLVFLNGLGFEGWMPRLVRSSGYKGTMAVASEGVKPRSMVDDGKKITDPHAWQDLANGKTYVANIAKALSLADPAGAEAYRANAAAYTKKIEDMDAWVKEEFSKIPRQERRMITSHDAFGYFGQAYGLTILAPIGYSTEAEASAQNVGKLIRQIKKEKIKALFIENMSDPRIIERIAKDAGVRAGGELYSDALSAPGESGATYLDMFKNNITKMVAAMGG